MAGAAGRFGLTILLPPGLRQLAKWTGLLFGVLTLAVAVVIAVGFKTGGPTYQFVESHPWIPAFGAGYSLGVDGIAVVLVLLTAVLIPLLQVAGWNDGGGRSHGDGDDPSRPASPSLRSSRGEAMVTTRRARLRRACDRHEACTPTSP